MHLLLTDETNLPSDPQARFFAYGGLFFDVESLPRLDQLIQEARLANGYQPRDELKFERCKGGFSRAHDERLRDTGGASRSPITSRSARPAV
jgi:hypothetical protein